MKFPLNDASPSPLGHAKLQMLAPFSRRYRQKLEMAQLPVEQRIVINHALVTRDRRLFYVQNCKAACTTIAQLIHYYEFGSFHPGDVQKTKRLQRGYPFRDAHEEALSSSGSFRFTFVRDPAARVRSAFFDFCVDEANPSSGPHRENLSMMGFSIDNAIERNFDIFLEYLERSLEHDPVCCERHWRPQVTNIGYGQVEYNHIGRVENFDEDWRRICDEAEVGKKFDDAPARATFNASSVRKAGGFAINGMQRQKIEKLYQRDYECFGY